MGTVLCAATSSRNTSRNAQYWCGEATRELAEDVMYLQSYTNYTHKAGMPVIRLGILEIPHIARFLHVKTGVFLFSYVICLALCIRWR